MPKCSSCGSNNVAKSSAVYEQGRSTTEGSASGFGASSSGTIGVSSANFDSETISDAARRNAPPPTGGRLAAVATLSLLVFAILFMIILFSGGFWAGLKFALFAIPAVAILLIVTAVTARPSEGEKAAQAAYRRQWYCFTCGDIFQGKVGSK